jgi:hypothetical protein
VISPRTTAVLASLAVATLAAVAWSGALNANDQPPESRDEITRPRAPDMPDPPSDTPNTTVAEKTVKVAAITTTYFPGSHADVIVGKFLRGFPTDDGLLEPRTQVVSLYIDQVHQKDIGLQVAHKFDIPVFESIRAALTLDGPDLAVDAVLLIGEHGDYSLSPLGQEMTPRRYFFDQISAVVIQSGRSVPIYNDKHLSYRWADAEFMYQTARKHKIPFWAASAMPVVWRKPNFQHPLGKPIDHALVIGFHMVERYGYHALEILQSQVERRKGGETGVRSVQCLSGDDVWKAAETGRWSMDLANTAIKRVEDGPGRVDPKQVDDPHVFLVEYTDGLKATVLMLGDGFVKKFAYAETRGKRTESLEYHTESGPTHAAFGYLGRNIENFLITGQTPNPVERTYLVTGMIESLMISRARGGKRIETPHLASIRYKPAGKALRPSGPRPTGASIGKWTELEPGKTPRAKTIPVGRDGTTRGPQKKPTRK